MTKSFPCWVCGGKGTWIEPVTDEGQGPRESCGYCEGEGMIEIGGAVHRRRKAESIATQIIAFSGEKDREYSWNELQEIGEKALNLIP